MEQYKAHTNKSLAQLEDQGTGCHIGSIYVGAPTCADDTALLSPSVYELYLMNLLMQEEANRDRYLFSKTKTKIQVHNSQLPSHVWNSIAPWKLSGDPVEIVSSQDHLGLTRCSSSSATTSMIKARLRTGLQTSYSLFGAGFHGLNGLNPVVSLKLWYTYVIPRLTFGLEALVIPPKLVKELDTYQYNTLRQLQHLPRGTSKAAVYLLLGVPPMEGHLDRKTITLFGHVARNTTTVEHDVISRQLAVKDLTSASWSTTIRHLLAKYDLPTAFSIIQKPPSKMVWKGLVKKAVATFWMKQLMDCVCDQTSVRYLNMSACKIGTQHHVWTSCSSDPFDTHQAMVKVKLLVGKYPLQTTISRFKEGTDATCILCNAAPETRAHFLLECPTLEPTRQPLLHRFMTLLHQALEDPPDVTDHDTLISLVLDPSSVEHLPADALSSLERSSRRLCYALHSDRADVIEAISSPNHPPLKNKHTTSLAKTSAQGCLMSLESIY